MLKHMELIVVRKCLDLREKTDEIKIKAVREHILSFPAYDLNEEEVNQQIERHQSDALESPNLPDSIYSANNPEGEYIRKTITKYIRKFFQGLKIQKAYL